MKSFYVIVGNWTNKSPKSIKNFVNREHLFPDLAEIARDKSDDAAVDCLVGLVKGNRRVRNK